MKGTGNFSYIFQAMAFSFVIEVTDLGTVNLSVLIYTCDLCHGVVSVTSGMLKMRIIWAVLTFHYRLDSQERSYVNKCLTNSP